MRRCQAGNSLMYPASATGRLRCLENGGGRSCSASRSNPPRRSVPRSWCGRVGVVTAWLWVAALAAEIVNADRQGGCVGQENVSRPALSAARWRLRGANAAGDAQRRCGQREGPAPVGDARGGMWSRFHSSPRHAEQANEGHRVLRGNLSTPTRRTRAAGPSCPRTAGPCGPGTRPWRTAR